MAYVPVPKDLTKVKTKVMFNLTKRQLVCFSGGALVSVPLFFLLKGPLGNNTAALCMILVMLPFFMLGVYEKNGQPLEKIVGNIIRVSFLRPRQRPGRGLDQGRIAGEPDQPRCQTGGANAYPHRQKSGRQSGQQGDQGRPQPPGLRQEIVAQGAPGPEGQGKHHQLPHGRYLMGSMRSVRPRI